MNKLINKSLCNGLRASAVFGLLVIPLHSLASTLEAISFESGVQDNFEVRLELDDASELQPEVYVIEQPARIVLDLPGVQNNVSQKQYALALANAKDAILLGTDDRTRLVVNLNSSAAYNFEVTGDELVLKVGSSDSSGAQTASAPIPGNSSATASPTSSPVTSQASVSGLVDFEFRRGEDGEGNLMLEFNTDRVNADITQRGSTISISFFDSEVADDIERVFDVQDFATPVGTVSVRQVGDEARVEIRTIDEFDYLAYQADSSYVVSVSPLTPEQEAEREREFAFTGERLSLNFQDIEVRSVLQLIADFTDLNLVASDTVTGNITLRLQNVPWDQALDIVLRTKGLDKRQEGNILLVAPLAEIAERERLEVEANKQLEELAPLVTEFIRIRYADAQDIFDLLAAEGSVTGNSDNNRGGGGGGEQGNENLISSRGSAVVDQRTNTIVLTDTEEKVAAFIEVVNQLDIPIRQVLIEARIVIANTDFRRELGVRWGGAGVRSIENGESALEFVGTRNGLADGGPLGFFSGQNELDLADTIGVDLGVVSPTSSFALAFLSDSTFIDLELSALEEEGFGEIVSQPKVVTGDQQPAEISAGQEIPFLEAASSGVATTSFREAVLSMEVTPQITPDGRVTLDLFVTQDSISDIAVDGQPVIDINEVRTQVLVDDGETLVLGGIFQTTVINDEERVPFLGDLPIIGKAFSSKVIAEEKMEVLFFITPKILADDLGAR